MQLPFNSYGLIIGIAIIVSGLLIESQIKKEKFDSVERNFLIQVFYEIGVLALIFGVIGARVWHVFTDFWFYEHDLVSIFFIWNGGLSILGGVMGGIIGILTSIFILPDLKSQSLETKKKLVLKLLDFSVFGLPVGQAIGRWGNYFNQELYGLPTSGFFKIFIDKEHRLQGYENRAYYHPLFLYEMIATGLFALALHWAYQKPRVKLPKLGSGNLFLLYILYYSIVRFLLDFLRIDKSILYSILGTNQLVLLLVIFSISTYFLSNYFRIITRYVFKK